MDSGQGRRLSVTEVSEVAMIPLPRRPAVLLFGHAGFAYGHISRCRKIARRLVERFPFDAYVVSSCPEYEPEEQHDAIHEVLLPPFRIASPDFLPERLPIPDRASSLAHVPADQLSAHRGRLLLALAIRIAPHAVLLEGFPFVRPLQAVEECGPTLAYLSQHSPRTLRCAGFNGVATSLWMGEHASLVERVLPEQLDRLFVYVDPAERMGLLERSPWLQKIAAKVHVTGYVVGTPPDKADAPLEILATFGSGVDAFRKIVLVLEAFFAFSASRPDFVLHLVTGGQLPDRGYREIARVIDGRADVRLNRVVPGLARRLNHYRLVISMGGYNACTELYQASTRGLVLPRFAPDFAEQMEQARKFQKAGAIECIVDAEASSPGLLAEAMARTLAAPPSPRLPIDIRGAETTAQSLAGATPHWSAARPA
jgi:predicted glycosyltransferase